MGKHVTPLVRNLGFISYFQYIQGVIHQRIAQLMGNGVRFAESRCPCEHSLAINSFFARSGAVTIPGTGRAPYQPNKGFPTNRDNFRANTNNLQRLTNARFLA